MVVLMHLMSGFTPQPQPQTGGKKRRIELIYADSMTHDVRIMANANRFVGHVSFSHENVILFCDSAYFYTDSNKVDAFGRVHIKQGDSLNLYGNRIKYEGNTRIARVTGDVRMINKSITLTTNELDFDTRANIGYYQTGGKIVDTANVLTSRIGRYYSNENMCLFKDSVKVTNKDFVLTADTLRYNTQTERVFLVGPTHIVGTNKKGTLYSEKGWYDTRKNVAELYKSSKIIGKEQSLQGDTIFYSKDAGTGRARSRVVLTDTTNHIAITGRTGLYNEKTKIAFVTDSAIFMQFSKKDTLFLHADTLKSIPDMTGKADKAKAAANTLVAKKTGNAKPLPVATSAAKDTARSGINLKKDSLSVRKDTVLVASAGKEKADTLRKQLPAAVMSKSDTARANLKADVVEKSAPAGKELLLTALKDSLAKGIKLPVTRKDSLSAPADTARKDSAENKIFMAYHHVRFFRKDLQGLCDSLSYQMKDSLMKLFRDPILWSDVHQMTAERIEYHPHKTGPSTARMENNGFIISMEDSVKFNQISGKTMIGYITDNELKNIDVNGNAVTLYYIKNKDKYSGLNKLESSKIIVWLMKGKIDSISFVSAPVGKSIPLKDLTPEDATLRGFQWRQDEKPKDRFDLYPIDDKRKKNAGSDKKPAKKKVAAPES